MREERKVFLLAAIVMMMAGAFAFQPIPKESAAALRVTRGKPFVAGAVFVNGRFIEPPYTVERWGTGIRINQTPVTGQVVDWNEFLKTQAGVKVERKTVEVPAPPAPAAPVVAAAVVSSVSDSADALDELFDDVPKSSKTKKKASYRPPAPAVPRPPVTRTEVSYSLEGEFRHNEASRALLARINDARTEIDRILRSGGFICFGDSYSRVTGDKQTLAKMIDKLPGLLQRSETAAEFRAGARAAGLIYLNEVLCDDLYRNRSDHPKITKRRDRILAVDKWDSIVQDAADPVF